MRRALTFILLGASLSSAAAAERKSWNKLRYAGGTLPIKTSPYDWNTKLTLTANPGSIEISVAPAKVFAAGQTVRLKPEQVISLSGGEEALRRVAEVEGAQLPARPPSLFGVLQSYAFMGIVYEENGKRGAVLLSGYSTWEILQALKLVTGKPIEVAP